MKEHTTPKPRAKSKTKKIIKVPVDAVLSVEPTESLVKHVEINENVEINELLVKPVEINENVEINELLVKDVEINEPVEAVKKLRSNPMPKL